jgi:DNA-binding transcriptional MerR regulator
MMTIHELANFSGISVRTLHYYDRIELLKPCLIEQNGYRKYDEVSLKRLRQIMFYKEMDLPLKEIRDILNHPGYNQKEAIRDQKDLLTAKRNRLTKLIELMEHILEGDDEVDFSAFEHNELEEVFRSRIMQMEEEYRQGIIELYGSVDAFIDRARINKAHLEESAKKHYGSVEKYIEVLRNAPFPKEGMGKLQLQLDNTVKKIASYKDEEVSNPEVQSLVCVWKETFKKMLEKYDSAEKFRETFQNIYHKYMESKEIIKVMDEMYGEGSTVYIGKAMEFNDNAQNL